MSSNSTPSDVIGAVVIARHGDRSEFFQDPLTYTASQTTISPLGTEQEFQLGQLLRSIYLLPNGTGFIPGLGTQNLFSSNVALIRADAGDEGGVIFDSAVALVQGLWPATPLNNITLANGSVIFAPLGGYQYVPIRGVQADEDISLEGFTNCNTFNGATAKFYNSSIFQQVASENADFLNSLKSIVGSRPTTLQNIYNIFDFINVQSIHNATFAALLPADALPKARALANFHEYGVFTSGQINGIGNIAGRTMIPSIVNGMQRIMNASDPLKFDLQVISYKPFLSLFNMTSVAQTYPQLAGLVDYASAIVFELRPGTSPSDPVVRMLFKNGTADTFNIYNMFSQPNADIPLSLFSRTLLPAAVNTTAEWCIVCDNYKDRGCGTCNNPVLAAKAQQIPGGHYRLSPPAAGAVGAAVTLAVIAITLTAFWKMGLIAFGHRPDVTRRESAIGKSRSDRASLNSVLTSQEKLQEHEMTAR